MIPMYDILEKANYDDSKRISDGQEYAGWWNEGRGM